MFNSGLQLGSTMFHVRRRLASLATCVYFDQSVSTRWMLNIDLAASSAPLPSLLILPSPSYTPRHTLTHADTHTAKHTVRTWLAGSKSILSLSWNSVSVIRHAAAAPPAPLPLLSFLEIKQSKIKNQKIVIKSKCEIGISHFPSWMWSAFDVVSNAK